MEVAENVKIHGHSIELPEGRSVFLAKRDGFNFLRFTNGDAKTLIKLSDEALQAVVDLARGANRGDHFWEVVIPFVEEFNASRDCAPPEPSGEGVNSNSPSVIPPIGKADEGGGE